MNHQFNFTRAISVLLLFVLFLSSFASCAGNGDGGDPHDPAETTQSESGDNSTEADGTEADASTDRETGDEHVHSFSDWIDTDAYTCLGEKIFARICMTCDAKEESYEMVQNTSETVSLDGKTVAFIGNSFIYYGNCVISGDQGAIDRGYFYQIARENGEDVTVYDYTYGGKNLEYIYSNVLSARSPSAFANIDYVFISEAGENNSSIIRDLSNIMSLFPEKTQFLYLCHSYTYFKSHSNITGAFSRMKELGISIVNWGELVYRVANGKDAVPGATESYNKETFIKNNSGVKNGSGAVGAGSSGDAHHPNLLSGYITALMAYTAVTGKSAVGQPYAFCDDSALHRYFNLDAFETAHYNGTKTTNFTKVFASPDDMKGLQTLMDHYIEKYGAFTGIVSASGAHAYGEEEELLHAGSANTKGWKTQTCTRCGHKKTVEVPGSDTARENLFLIPKEEVRAAGYTTVKEYMLSGKSGIAYQATSGWGRIGYASIQGMASLCDGSRTANSLSDGSVLYWKIKDRTARYHADGSAGGKYCSLIGYEIKAPMRANGLSLFVLHGGALGAYDILGGTKNADGSISWTVLATCNGTDGEYIPYDDSTDVFCASFDPAEFDCLEIGVISATSNVIYMSELEVYGEYDAE